MRSFDFRICFLQLWARHNFFLGIQILDVIPCFSLRPLMVAPRSWRTFTGEPLKVLPLSLSQGHSPKPLFPTVICPKVLSQGSLSLSRSSFSQKALSPKVLSPKVLSPKFFVLKALSLCFFYNGSLSQDPLSLKRLSLSRFFLSVLSFSLFPALSLSLTLSLSLSLSLFPALSLSLPLSLSLSQGLLSQGPLFSSFLLSLSPSLSQGFLPQGFSLHLKISQQVTQSLPKSLQVSQGSRIRRTMVKRRKKQQLHA